MSQLSPKYREFCSPAHFEDLLKPVLTLMDTEQTKQFNKRARKITFEPFFRANVLFCLTPAKTLGALQKSAADDPLYGMCGAHIDVSVPGLSQANATRPMDSLVDVLSAVMAAIHQLPGESKVLREINPQTLGGIKDLLVKTQILDASSFHLPTKIAKWASWGHNNQGGVKVHLKLNSGYGGLEKVILSRSRDNDAKYFDNLLELKDNEGAIYLYDCGYHKVEAFDQITDSGNFVVSRLHGSVSYEVESEEDLADTIAPCGYTLHKKMIAYIGSKENNNRSKHKYMLLEVTDTRGKRGILISNMLELEPEKVCALYLYRWTIETSFRWLKHTLEMVKFISYSPNGVMMQLLIALIVYGLLVLYQQGNKRFGLTRLLNEIYLELHQALYEYGYQQGLQAAKQSSAGLANA